MRLEARKHLLDIQLAGDRVDRFSRGKTFAEYLADEMLRAAVERLTIRQTTAISLAINPWTCRLPASKRTLPY